MSQVYKTYDKVIERKEPQERAITPIAHMHANAQIEITLDETGGFQDATKVNKEDAITLIPVTEASAGRSSGAAPHSLCDTLSNIAGDFADYCKSEKEKAAATKKFEAYVKNLEHWALSEHTHPKVQAVYQYIKKKEMIQDLEKSKIIEFTEGKVFSEKKINGQPYEKTLVRFRVWSNEIEEEDRTWEDAELIQAYTAYYLSNLKGRKDICYFLGSEHIISENHPKGIMAANYGAKIISINDSQGYTYRGRFQTEEQSYALSYEASQKIHSTLTWLAKNHGASVGIKSKRLFLCWNPEGKKTPEIVGDMELIEDEHVQASIESYRNRVFKTFLGYKNQFKEGELIVIMGLDAATTGRLSVTYYNELFASDFLERIRDWGSTCNWFYLKFKEDKQPYSVIETPTFERIVKCALGREQGKFLEVDDKVLKEHTQRLVKCMVEKQPIPFDFVQAITVRASTPMAYTRGNRERVLSTACAIITKYYSDKKEQRKGEQDFMKLDLNETDRSYLFGRLLAVCEKVERATYEKGETRDPNAIRLQSAYVNHPLQTWKILETQLNPYFQKLYPGLRENYRKLISEIVMLLREEDEPNLNQSLKEKYLLGYYLQRAELNQKKEEPGKDNQDEELNK